MPVHQPKYYKITDMSHYSDIRAWVMTRGNNAIVIEHGSELTVMVWDAEYMDTRVDKFEGLFGAWVESYTPE